MRIWIDICHTPQYNFYCELILQLLQRGHSLYITVLKRGKTPLIVRRELIAEVDMLPIEQRNVRIYEIGRHRMTKWSALLEANILRLIQLFFWRMFHHVDLAFGNGMQPAIIQWLFRGPSYSFDDDPQTADCGPKIKCNTECNFCLYEDPVTENKGAKVLRCLKEWAYLNPRTFKPNVNVLQRYGLQPKQYLFLREVSVGTVNYAAQSPQAILSISPLIQQFTQWGHTQWCQAPMCNFTQSCQTPLCKNPLPNPEITQITQWGQSLLCNSSAPDPNITYWGQSLLCNFKVLFSLEEKNRRSEYPADWILLQEPIEDIHSLMYYAAGLVSSGDSMAREAALLGIPAYYLGVRHSMPANLAASKVANLQNETTQPFESWLRDLAQPKDLLAPTSLSPEQQSAKRVEYLSKQQDSLRQKIDSDFIDINAYMLSLVNQP